MPQTFTTVPELCAALATGAAAEADALIVHGTGGHRLTFRDIGERVALLDAALADVTGPIVLYLDDSPEWLLLFLAISSRLRPAAIVDPRLDAQQVVKQLADIRPALVIAGERHAADLRRLTPTLNVVAPAAVAARVPTGLPAAPPAPSDPAVILYTSGSTGTPRGVVLSHRALMAGLARGIARTGSHRSHICLAPLSHIAGLLTTLSALAVGGKRVFVPSIRPRDLFDAIKAHEVDFLLGPPILFDIVAREILQKLGHRPREHTAHALLLEVAATRPKLARFMGRRMFRRLRAEHGPALRTLIAGGSRLAPRTAQSLLALGYDLRDAYGLSETCGAVALTEAGALRPGLVGRQLDGVELRITDPDASGTGEVCVRSDQLMDGYLGQPEATAAVLQDGWFHTGDLGHLDERGRLKISGRIKETIVTVEGKKVFPDDLEAVFTGVEGVAELCVLGLPVEANEVPVLVVRLETPASEGPVRAELAERNRRLPPHLQVRRTIVVAQPLPRVGTKPSRLRLRRQLLEAGPT